MARGLPGHLQSWCSRCQCSALPGPCSVVRTLPLPVRAPRPPARPPVLSCVRALMDTAQA
eukprot:4846778-Pyramimonas_sp.AAC.1